MIREEHLEKLSERLKIILNEEIKLGNKLVETSEAWPQEDSIFIAMHYPFFGKYKDDTLDYDVLTDRHYWQEEYYDRATNHILVYPFEK